MASAVSAASYYRDLLKVTSNPEVCNTLVTGLLQVDGIIIKV